jgi:predicted PurR-regulated permease PerM
VKNVPTAFQKNAFWTAITALSITSIGAIAVGLIYLLTRIIAFLQPILIPFALAGVIAYLLDPAVRWIERRGLSRQRAVLLVFAAFTLLITGLGLWIVPKIIRQSDNLDERVLSYSQTAGNAVMKWSKSLEEKFGLHLLPIATEKSAATPPAAPATNDTATPTTTTATADASSDKDDKDKDDFANFDLQQFLSGDWVRTSLPVVAKNAWNIVKTSVGGFLGVFGFLLSMIIVPLYLFYFLIESAKIKQTWSDYLPLRASAFKDEVVSCLTEINGYLIAFFRGQLFVSLINGFATGIGLMILGLDFGLLIGLGLCVLGIIPYLGIALCWIPAVIIASVQTGAGILPDDSAWWALPLAVTAVFAIVQQVDGLFISPKVVGESVGLHPMTVIVSVFLWTLILGGLLGAILAVPMTASIKVLFQRYVWRARLAPQIAGGSAPPLA